MDDVDAVVIGSGPNGLVAGALLARAGWSVTVLERSAVAGGAVHSAEHTVPGYVHDTYSAFYGLLHSSPVLAELGLDRSVQWAQFPSPVAAAVSPEHAAVCHAEPQRTAAGLARRAAADGPAWLELYRWWCDAGTAFLRMMLGPVGAPGAGVAFARRARQEGLLATTQMLLGPLDALCAERLADPAARALLAAGVSHADVPVDVPGSAPPPSSSPWRPSTSGCPCPSGGRAGWRAPSSPP